MPKHSVIENLSQFDNALGEIARLDSRIEIYDFRRKEAILAAETRFKGDAALLAGQRALLAEELEKYYRDNRAELEKSGKKSITLQFGVAGIRTGQPEFCLLKPWKWGATLQAIKDAGRKAFIRSKEEIDKPALKAAKLNAAELAEFGLKIHQSETFYFETFPVKGTVTPGDEK